ncbi:MAG: metal ABC transporter substrate-binding protein [Porticoccaceae bacterium]
MLWLRCLFAAVCIAAPMLASAELKVVTTTSDLAAIARAVGGKFVDAESLTPGPTDPHFMEAKPSMIRRVASADVLLIIGADLEIGWLGPVLETARNRKVLPGAPGYVDLSTSVPLLDKSSGPVNRALGDVHALGNPHYPRNPGNGILIAKAISERFQQLDPAHADQYRQNTEFFIQELNSRIVEWKKRLEPLRGQSVITYHRSFNYLAAAFGFQIIGQVEPIPGIPPNASHVEQLIGRIRTEKAGLLLMEAFYERRSAAYLAAQTGIKIVIVPHAVDAEPQIKSYFDLFDVIVERLSLAGGT